MPFTFSAWFSGTSRGANKFSKLKTLHRGPRKGCSSFHTPASNLSCKLTIQVTGRNARLSRLPSSQMPSIHSGSPGPDCVQATGSLRLGLTSKRVEWITLCCGFRLGVRERQNQIQDRFVYVLFTSNPSVPRDLSGWLLCSIWATF